MKLTTFELIEILKIRLDVFNCLSIKHPFDCQNAIENANEIYDELKKRFSVKLVNVDDSGH